MAYSFLVFDFGGDEDAAQKARHRIDGWKQGFRLDKKLQLKFERKEMEETVARAQPKTSKSAGEGKAKPGAKSKATNEGASKDAPAPVASADVRLIVRLDFSDHEKLSHQRWLERIPAEEPFRNAKQRIIRVSDADFQSTSTMFDSLD